MPTHGIVYAVVGGVLVVAALVFYLVAATTQKASERSGPLTIGTICLLMGLLLGITGPLWSLGDANTNRQAKAEIQKAHPDFQILSLDAASDGTITYIRPGPSSDPVYCSAQLLELNGRFLVATIGAQCAPYNR